MAGIEVMRAHDAPMAGGDPTRGFAVACDGLPLMPGLTRAEAVRACTWLAQLDPTDRPLALAEVALAVVLTDGAGPYLLDAEGRLVLVLGPQAALAGACLAMGAAGPGFVVGLVRAVADGGWAWLVRAEVHEAHRVAALDSLDALPDWPGVRRWSDEWAGTISTLVP